MRRMWVMGAATVVCLVISGVPALGQESAEPMSALPLPLVATGSGNCTVLERGSRGTSDGLVEGAAGARGQTLDCVLAISEPRVSGTARLTLNGDCFTGPQGWECGDVWRRRRG